MHRFFRIHFLNLLDGSPYPSLPSDVMWEFPQEVVWVTVEYFFITGSKLMMQVKYWEMVSPSGMKRKRFVWDWRTGDLVILLWLG